LFIYLFIFSFFPSIVFDLFFFHSDSFLFIYYSFLFLTFFICFYFYLFFIFSYFSCLCFCLLASFNFDLIFVLFFLHSVASSFVLLVLSYYLNLNLFVCNFLLACLLHSIYVLGTLWTVAVKIRIQDLVIYFWFT